MEFFAPDSGPPRRTTGPECFCLFKRSLRFSWDPGASLTCAAWAAAGGQCKGRFDLGLRHVPDLTRSTGAAEGMAVGGARSEEGIIRGGLRLEA